jgi:hypothetical protein
VSSVVNYRGSLGTSVKTSGYSSTLLSSTGVSSSTSGIEPVSPEEGYHVEDDRPSLSTNAHGECTFCVYNYLTSTGGGGSGLEFALKYSYQRWEYRRMFFISLLMFSSLKRE